MKKCVANFGKGTRRIKLVPDMLQKFVIKSQAIYIFAFGLALVVLLQNRYSSKENTLRENFYNGICMGVTFFVLQGLLYFPSGPFIHPHPIMWRLVFSLSLLYLAFLIILYFLSLDQARYIFTAFDASLGVPLIEKDYGVNCELTHSNIKDVIFDVYFVAHFFGWFVKALMLRHRVLLWVISILWELVELFFIYALDNFKECWWDSWVVDVLICNGLGIELGIRFGKYLEVMDYRWFKSGDNLNLRRIKNFLLQLAPTDWTKVEWSTTVLTPSWRFYVITIIIVGSTITDLNVFFLKYILWIPPNHWLLVSRMVIISIISLPSLRQIYLYCENPSKMPFGMQACLLVLILIFEILIIGKHYNTIFPPVPKRNLIYAGIVIAIYVVVVKVFVIIVKKRKQKQKPSNIINNKKTNN